MAPSAFAQFSGGDDFSGASEDTAKWGSDINQGVGILTQTNGYLQYTTSGTPTSNDQAIRPWIANYGSYTQNWTVTLDVNLPLQTVTGNEVISIGLAVADASNTSSDMLVAMQQDVPHGTLFFSGIDIGGVSQTPIELGGQTPGLTAVQLSYDFASQSITAWYDADGSTGGYDWTMLASNDISSWGMTSSDQFLVAITGSSQGGVDVSNSSLVWADNFQAETVPEPASWSWLAGIVVGLWTLMHRRMPSRATGCMVA